MAGIAITQMTCRKVKDTHEKCGKHIRVVVAAGHNIDIFHDACGIVLTEEDDTQNGLGHCHDESRGNAFAADIPNTEE